MKEYSRTGEACPESGNYRQVETGNITWYGKDEIFAPYYERVGRDTDDYRGFYFEIRKVRYKLVDTVIGGS